MTARGKVVIVLAQIPMLDGDPIRARRFAYLEYPRRDTAGLGSCQLPHVAAWAPPFGAIRGPDRHALFRRAPSYEGQIIYFDDSHLNETGARLYGEVAARFLSLGAVSSPPSRVCDVRRTLAALVTSSVTEPPPLVRQ
jgi:hypothetical protein